VSDGFPTTAPVGSFPKGASPYGALDMSGNVCQLTERLAGEAFDRAVRDRDGNLPEYIKTLSGSIGRGGSWLWGKSMVRTTGRTPLDADGIYDYVGFRAALSE
jgi:formylglycine-generating enzyme required for sulfatase activity